MLDCLEQPGDDSPELRYVFPPPDEYDAPLPLPEGFIEFVPSPAGILARDQARRQREHVCVIAGFAIGIGFMAAGNALSFAAMGRGTDAATAFVCAAASTIAGCLAWGAGEKRVPH